MTHSIVATIRAKHGQPESLKAIPLQLVSAVRAHEPGCLRYTWSQGDDAHSVVFMERCADDAALAFHCTTAHDKTLGRAMGAHLGGAPAVLRLVELA